MLRYERKIPVMASCARCERKFFTPTTFTRDAASSYANSSSYTAAAVAYLAITLTAAIRTEEAHLTEKFGSEYPDYRAGRTPTVSRRFSLARATRNREYRAMIGLLVAIAVLALKALL
jgi:hypothetical protein